MSEDSAILCVVCQKRRPQWPQVCEGDRRRIRDQLTVELPDQYALLDPEPGKADGPRISGTRTPPLPGRLDVFNLRGPATHRVRDDSPDAADYQVGEVPPLLWLAQWVWDWREIRGQGEHLPKAIVLDLVKWLDVRLDWAMDEHPAVDAFAAELNEQLSTLKRVNGFKSDWRKIGHCPEDTDNRICGTPLYANPWIDIIACRSCGTRWDRQSWLFLGGVLREVDTEDKGEGAA